MPGNQLYMPPEALGNSPQYIEKLDVFSLGVVMLEVQTREHPSPSMHGIGVTPEVTRRQSHLDEVSGDNPLKEIIIRCLCDSYEDRPTAQEVHKVLSRLI